MDFCGGGVAAGSKVMVVWGELQAGGEALQVMCCFKSVWLLLAEESDCIDIKEKLLSVIYVNTIL